MIQYIKLIWQSLNSLAKLLLLSWASAHTRLEAGSPEKTDDSDGTNVPRE